MSQGSTQPVCQHPVATLHLQMRVNAETMQQEQHLICDGCGKDISLDTSQWFLWMKLLEMRDMIRGFLSTYGGK
jgi:hypothetical protein